MHEQMMALQLPDGRMMSAPECHTVRSAQCVVVALTLHFPCRGRVKAEIFPPALGRQAVKAERRAHCAGKERGGIVCCFFPSRRPLGAITHSGPLLLCPVESGITTTTPPSLICCVSALLRFCASAAAGSRPSLDLAPTRRGTYEQPDEGDDATRGRPTVAWRMDPARVPRTGQEFHDTAKPPSALVFRSTSQAWPAGSGQRAAGMLGRSTRSAASSDPGLGERRGAFSS